MLVFVFSSAHAAAQTTHAAQSTQAAQNLPQPPGGQMVVTGKKSSASAQSAPDIHELLTLPPPRANDLSAANLSRISTARLAGQMLLIGFNATSKNSFVVKKLAQEASLGKVGGIVFRAANFASQPSAEALVERFANIAVANPLILALDPAGLSGQFGSLAASDFAAERRSMASARLGYLKSSIAAFRLGIDMIFAPNLSYRWPQKRAQVHKFSLYAQQFASAAQEAYLLQAAGNFPGEQSAARVQEVFYLEQLRPFYDAIITRSADVIVLSNKIFPAIDAANPAAQSAKIHSILRSDLGFSGLVASADLLGGDLDEQPFAERIIASINAGCDLLYLGQSSIRQGESASVAVSIIEDAVASGKIARERLEASYRRILALKARLREHTPEEQ